MATAGGGNVEIDKAGLLKVASVKEEERGIKPIYETLPGRLVREELRAGRIRW